MVPVGYALLEKGQKQVALCVKPPQRYEASPATWDHKVLPATGERAQP